MACSAVKFIPTDISSCLCSSEDPARPSSPPTPHLREARPLLPSRRLSQARPPSNIACEDMNDCVREPVGVLLHDLRSRRFVSASLQCPTTPHRAPVKGGSEGKRCEEKRARTKWPASGTRCSDAILRTHITESCAS